MAVVSNKHHHLCETDRIFACHTGPTVWGQCLLWYKDTVKELKLFNNIPNIAKLFNYSRAFMDANKVLGGSFALMVDGQMVYKQVSLLKTSTPTSLHHISGLQARWPGSIVPQVFPLWHFSLQHIYLIWVRENPGQELDLKRYRRLAGEGWCADANGREGTARSTFKHLEEASRYILTFQVFCLWGKWRWSRCSLRQGPGM